MPDPTMLDIVNALLGAVRDLLIYFAPLIGVIAGLKFIKDWVMQILYGKK